MKPILFARTAAMILVLMPATVHGSSRTPIGDLRLTVLSYDYVHLPAHARIEAEANAKRVLGQAGLELEFVGCYLDGIDSGHPKCTGPLGPAVLMLRIFHPRFAERGKQLGYVVTAPDGGANVTIFINPAVRKARVNSLSDGALLGHAIAHEIGHLLLGANAHASAGIMRPVWRPCDEEWMAKGALQFDSGQARTMRTTLLTRAGREVRAGHSSRTK